tara:strand:+ start:508 stop:711 length:204 start_codon:yes stop_codon:yes gene_type:complete
VLNKLNFPLFEFGSKRGLFFEPCLAQNHVEKQTVINLSRTELTPKIKNTARGGAQGTKRERVSEPVC